MKLNPQQVQKVAKLANIPVSEEEVEKYSDQLSKILDYIDQLNSVDTAGVEPTFNITGLSNVLRDDEVGESLSQEEALKNTSQKKEGFFVTKGVFEEG
ncbi:MAG: Aspartyl/glutamyl-tRNA(Asn/Gln) amidotransferase subunit C [Candidatus Daviesbacteria bacterium GW2011_GWA1_41_61]|uniref:Aspartyl/glutamyl-tRNA(Asn/Gln) amidotransferase subunit C n=1 Tax=Candidatus Daviesbacteria bacterium GW2011_GWA2_40_9 TaxID=1618424 RepID=A0A0G0U6V5_9BACT|nr:MAG: Aspartyl/glutamyl-tRNA(Asn/Gln) amidotransferase subunit C [Candidatus Daviesbacteria bacterium GW2011_GWC1_40_9]KKR82941.1 MAG: Aspartyl/glutamyl-tRNA(Asn/Gln) amidotransferase subunit C [Candidatus Daviesbacteria bacterium GW2011_GWA2_40_9]KKR92868.1 MAG: Aspartyl/glutamyl-tRNA(Asn/Gln) amidotransferase subunit C [Candidatus Daviesbacteria bacterium GW2011_GWB1_41_15]KKS15412.1 MAG: Aspartyl/glutamyl-tRNA(Asn/Gln) amidotransferase subunit C [Candidatus Daviesbacteria bacterium GW2011_G